MKFNLKKKIMLTLLAGNMFCMGSALAALNIWYGNKNNLTQWNACYDYNGDFYDFNPADACLSGAKLIVDENTVIDGKKSEDVRHFLGGHSLTETVSNNSITINGGSLMRVKGGNSISGLVCDNVVNLNGGSATVYGGCSDYGNTSSNYGNVIRNMVIVTGGTNQSVSGGISNRGSASYNVVKQYGGQSLSLTGGGGDKATVKNNSVLISGGSVGYVQGGSSNRGSEISENSVIINGGTIAGDVYGGSTRAHGSDSKGIVSANNIIINNGSIGGNVYGGYSSGGDAIDNIVNIEGGSFGNSGIYGGWSTTKSTGNIFNLKTRLSGLKEVAYFQIMNFTLPRDTTNGSQILSAKSVSLDNTKINVAAMAGVSLSDNDTITLIHTTNGITGTFTVGDITLNGNWEIKQDGNDIILVASDEDNPPDDPDNPNPPAPPTPINVDDGYDGSQIIHNLATGSAAEKWCNNIATNQPNADMRQNTINTMTNMEQLANVQHGNYSLTNLAMDETFNHMSVRNRNSEYSSMPKYKLRNTAARRGNYRIDQIDVGRVDDVLPTHQLDRIIDGDSRRTSPRTSRYNGYSRNNYNDNYYNNARNSDRDYYVQRRSYKNYEYISSGGEEEQMVWATYIRSKEEIKDMEVGHLKQDSTLKYNGATVGADLWQSDHGFGGVALTYAKGDVNSVQKVSSVKNDVDYYGGSIYHRTDSGKFSVQLDATYSNSKNDIKMQTLGAEDIKIKPKTEAYSAGIKIEEPIEINEKTNIVPFIGVRYTHMRTEKTQSNIDIAYGSNEQDMCSVPLGVSLRNQFEVSDSMKLGTVLDAGYIFNIGDRKGKQRLIYGAVTDTVNYNIVDKGQYFIKAAIQAICENMMWELGYHYSKSSKVKDDKWYVNADFKF